MRCNGSTPIRMFVLAGILAMNSALAQRMTRVSVSSDGQEGNDHSAQSSVSDDGRYVVFTSGARNLITGDNNAAWDVLLKDRLTGVLERVSVSSDGAEANSGSWLGRSEPLGRAISADGRFVVFTSGSNNLTPGDQVMCYDSENRQYYSCPDVFLRDRWTGTTSLITGTASGVQANAASGSSTISADGRFIAFSSSATNLVPSDTTAWPDIFVYDRQTGIVIRASDAWDGSEADYWSDFPVLSADGRYVAFMSYAANLVPNDSNGFNDIFVRDLQAGSTRRVSISSSGAQGNDYVGWYFNLSADGRYASFCSGATNLVSDDTNGTSDVFVHDLLSGLAVRASENALGDQGNGASCANAISANGRFVLIQSSASNLVAGDTNLSTDAFIKDLQSGGVTRVSVTSGGAQTSGYTQGVSVASPY